MKKKIATILIIILFIFSFAINSIGDGRIYYKVLGIAFIATLLLFKLGRDKLLGGIQPLFIYASCTSMAISLVAYFFPAINNGLNSILLNHFISHIIILCLAYIIWKFENEAYELSLRAISFCIMLSGVFGIIQVLVLKRYPGVDLFGFSIWQNRLSSVYVNPIPAGTVFLVGFWLSILTKKRGLAILQRGICLISIVLTQSRSVWIGLMISIMIMVIINREDYSRQFYELSRFKRIISVFVFGILVVLVSLFIILYMPHRVLGMFSGEAYNVRMSYWRYVWALFKQQDLFWELFGHGYGSSSAMMLNSPVYYEPYAIIDNGLLTVLYENGAICLFALFIVFYRAWLVVKDKSRIGSIEWTCGMVVLALIIPSCFYEIQGWTSPILLALLCMAPFVARIQENK